MDSIGTHVRNPKFTNPSKDTNSETETVLHVFVLELLMAIEELFCLSSNSCWAFSQMGYPVNVHAMGHPKILENVLV